MGDFIGRYAADILENLELVLLCILGLQVASKLVKVIVIVVAVVAVGLLVFTYMNGGTLYSYEQINISEVLNDLRNWGQTQELFKYSEILQNQ